MWRGLLSTERVGSNFDLELNFIEDSKMRKSKLGIFENQFACRVLVRENFSHHRWLNDIKKSVEGIPEKHSVLITKETGSDKAVISIDLASFVALLEEAGYDLVQIADKDERS